MFIKGLETSQWNEMYSDVHGIRTMQPTLCWGLVTSIGYSEEKYRVGLQLRSCCNKETEFCIKSYTSLQSKLKPLRTWKSTSSNVLTKPKPLKKKKKQIMQFSVSHRRVLQQPYHLALRARLETYKKKKSLVLYFKMSLFKLREEKCQICFNSK